VQHFFLAEATERRFGEMSGPELAAMSPTNRYRPAWIPLRSVPALRLLPLPAKQLVVAVANGGDWPAEAQIVKTTDVTR
jgi:hypothetical protein